MPAIPYGEQEMPDRRIARLARVARMIVVFDGECAACGAYARFLRRHDRQARLALVPARSPRGMTECRTRGLSPDDPATMLVVDGDLVRIRSDAALAAIAALGGGWRAIGLLALIPRPIRDAAYAAFARRRYRWFGRAATCPLTLDSRGDEAR